MSKAFRKRLIIILVYFLLFSFFIFFIYVFLHPVPSCFDGEKNQNEKGTDCEGVCEKECEEIIAQDLIIGKLGAVPSGISGKYDFYAYITNPNAIFGVANFDYKIFFKNENGVIVSEKNGSNFILPGERKYIVENNIEAETLPADFSLEIINLQWSKFSDYYEKPKIQIVNKKYNEVSGGIGFSEATGLLRNESGFDFETIDVQIILKDSSGEVLALNSTQLKTIKSGEARDFRAFWPNSFPGIVNNFEAQAEVNVFKSDTFLKRFYKTEDFQKQYKEDDFWKNLFQ